MSEADVIARGRQIHTALGAGAEPLVCVVRFDDGSWTVQWGVEGLTLSCFSPHAARDLAKVFDEAGYYPAIASLLREAADICDSRQGGLQ